MDLNKNQKNETSQMNKWELVFVLPNIEIKTVFENNCIAIVPYHDARLQEIITSSEVFSKIVNGFIDDFNRKVLPAALIMKSVVPGSLRNLEAIVDFRNIVALSVILKNWSMDNSFKCHGATVFRLL